MGIDIYVLDLLLRHRSAEPGGLGDGLTLGRQGLHVSTQDAMAIATHLIRQRDPDANVAFLSEAGGYGERLLQYIGCRTIRSMDFSPYEGADILHDLNAPVPDELVNAFDFIFDGGTIEHVFDVAMAYRNVTRMLRPGGVFIGVSPANNFVGHGFYQFSPELFWRVFSETNGFTVKSMQLVALDGYPAPVDAPDPEARGRRLEIGATRWPQYLTVVAQKNREVDLSQVLQSDYARIWDKGTNAMAELPFYALDKLEECLPGLLQERRRVCLYPAGSMTAALLDSGLLAGLEVVAVGDRYFDQPQWHGLPVLKPDAFGAAQIEAVLIASISYHEEMVRQLLPGSTSAGVMLIDLCERGPVNVVNMPGTALPSSADTSVDVLAAFPLFVPASAGLPKDVAALTVRSVNQLLPFMSALTATVKLGGLRVLEIAEFLKSPDDHERARQIKALFDKYGSDKANSHDYHKVYGAILQDRAAVRTVLEVGLGTFNTDIVSNMGLGGRPGASLRAFRDFLPKARIFGADVDRRILFAEERIETFFVDQTDPGSFEGLGRSVPGEFDLIIDDGLHAPNANILTLNFALPRLKPGGWVVVEDVSPHAIPVWEVVAGILPDRYETHLVKTAQAMLVAIKRVR